MPIARSIKKLFRPSRAIVLMYHRIASVDIDPWQLSVSKDNFRQHLQVLASTAKVISTDELIDSIITKNLASDRICITSDDGYEDNFLNALPLLEEYKMPATFYIPSGAVGSNEPFWWDMMTKIFLETEKLPVSLDIRIADRQFSYTLNNNGEVTNDELSMHAAWYWPQHPPTQRCEIYLELWMHLRDQPSMLINETVNELKSWSGVEAVNTSGNFPMSRHQLLETSLAKYVTTGVHTITHAALGAFSKRIQQTEINGCKEFLDDNLGKKHLSIAFPYGNYNKDTLEVTKRAGLKGAFTTDPKPVTIKSDVYQLGRYQVINQTGEQFKKQLDNWLNN